jgi:transcription-repair coupling factor (superfamily II helicase)
LPSDYVSSERERLEAYRRLANVTSSQEVSDIRAEWEDRYGPIPDVAVRLLEVAQLRAECVRVGVRDLVVVKGTGFGGPEWIAKMGPVQLRVSQEVRFERLFPNGLWKPNEYGDEGGQVQVGLMKKIGLASAIATFLQTMFPPEDEATRQDQRSLTPTV